MHVGLAGAVLHQEPGGLGVGPNGPVVVGLRTHPDGEVHDVGEVVGQVAVVARLEVDGHRRDADRLGPLPAAVGGEAGGAPHLVVGGEDPGDGVADLAGQSGDEHLAVAEHARRVGAPVERRGARR